MRKRKNQTRASAIGGMVGLLIIVGLIFLITGLLDREDNSQNREASTEETYQEENYLTFYDKDYIYTHKIETYLVLGTDLSGNPQGEGEDYQGNMADFLLLLVIDQNDRSYSLIPVSRETMTEISILDKDDQEVKSRVMQLCTAHWYGSNKHVGCENTVEAISNLYGMLDINGYYELPMEAIPMLNHAVDGVTVTIEDDFTQIDPTMTIGSEILLNDEQASHYVHDRMNIGDGENESRMRRQKTYIQGFLKKAKEKAKEDSRFAVNTYKSFKEISTTNIKGNKISKLIKRLSTYEDRGILEIAGTTQEGMALDDGLVHSEFYPDPDSVVEVFSQAYSLQEAE